MPASNLSNPISVITLDGLSGSGKSTLARLLAERLGWVYLDSGAWYRAATWAILQAGRNASSSSESLAVLSTINLQSHHGGQMSVDGAMLGNELRTPEVDRAVADVADHLAVRAELTTRMRRLLVTPGIAGVVADGRDAGTVIFPKASLKIFVEASLQNRAQRRHQQMQDADVTIDPTEVSVALGERDQRDQARGEFAPRMSDDGVMFENNSIGVEQAVGCLLELVSATIGDQAVRD